MFKQITTSIRAIGVTDTDLQLFENQYPVPDGVTYNSYLVSDNGVTAVIDAVDKRRGAEWFEKLAIAAPSGVDYLVVQHMEPDHSATVADFMARYPQAKIVTSPIALKMLGQFFPTTDFSGHVIEAGEGSTLEAGSHTLTFLAAPMVHWPEVIVTYDKSTRTLFSADAFGTFGTSDDYASLWPGEARRYYTNIVGKYGPQVQRLLSKASGLEIDRLCPLHGPVIEGDDIARSVKLYDLWSRYEPEEPEGVLVAYASIYGNTASVARDLAAMLEGRGTNVVCVDLCRQDVSEAVSQAFRMGRIVAAAPTYDAGLFPAMHDFLYHLRIKALRGRRFGLIENGSWSPSAARTMEAMIGELSGCTVVSPAVTIKSAPDASTPGALEKLASAIIS